METINSPILAAITLLGFAWLSYAALNSHEEAAYSHSVFAVLSRMPQSQADGLNEVWQSYSLEELKRNLPGE